MKNVRVATFSSLLLFCAGQANAEAWFWESDIRAFVDQDDNVRLSTTGEIDAASLGLSASTTLSLETEDTQVSLTPRVIVRQYSSNEDLDSNVLGVDGGATKVFERSELGFKGSVTKDTTLTSEFEDSGNLRVKIDRLNAKVEPSYRYKITPISAIRASAGLRSVDYDDGVEFNYYDYTASQVEGSYELDITRRDQVTASIYAGHYSAEDLGSTSDSVGFRLGLAHKFTESTSIDVAVGAYDLDSERDNAGTIVSESSSGSSFRAGLNHKRVLTNFRFVASSQLEPSSLGNVRQTDRVDVSVNHSFTRRLTSSLSGVVLRTESTSDLFTGEDRHYASLNASVAWSLDPLWKIRFAYRHAKQEYDHQDDSATSSRVSMSIEYNSRKSNI